VYQSFEFFKVFEDFQHQQMTNKQAYMHSQECKMADTAIMFWKK